MARGRKRNTHDSTIPEHIDQARIPAGIYWDKSGAGRWYARNPPGSAKATTTVAQRAAMLSDLHAIAEQRKGADVRGTVGHVIAAFEEHDDFRKELSARTQSNYQAQAKIVRAFRLTTGQTLDQLFVDRINPPMIQRIVDRIAGGDAKASPPVKPKPTKANHLLRYVRMLFAWGIRRGHCKTNPAKGVRQAREVGDAKMPTRDAFGTVLAFARERGSLKPHTKGSVAPYLAHVMVISRACRLRGIEAATLTDSHALDAGIYCERRKGSRDNVTRWTPELRDAWDALVALRAEAWKRHASVIPMRPEDRPLVVSEDGGALRKSSLDTAWQRLMKAATDPAEAGGVITSAERFTLHGLKHRGITDSADKSAGGHKSESMRQRYDHSVPLVDAATDGDFSGDFSGAVQIDRKRSR